MVDARQQKFLQNFYRNVHRRQESPYDRLRVKYLSDSINWSRKNNIKLPGYLQLLKYHVLFSNKKEVEFLRLNIMHFLMDFKHPSLIELLSMSMRNRANTEVFEYYLTIFFATTHNITILCPVLMRKAIEWNNIKCIKILIEKGMSPNTTIDGTPVIFFIRCPLFFKKYINICNREYSKTNRNKLDLNLQNVNGDSYLMYICTSQFYSKMEDYIRYLVIDMRVDTSIKNKDGRSVIDIIEDRKCDCLTTVIRSSINQVEASIAATATRVADNVFKNVKNELLCPIMQSIMTDPVIATDGYTYEKSAIERWIDKKNTSPMTNMILLNKTLIPNRAIKCVIQAYNITT